MKLGYTLHCIRRNKQELPVNQVAEFEDTEYGEMFALGAVRQPTADEIALYRMTHPVEASVVSIDAANIPAGTIIPGEIVVTKTEAKKKAADADKKSEGSTDPDEIDLNV